MPRTPIPTILRRVTEHILDEMQRIGWFACGPEQRYDRPPVIEINRGWCNEWADAAVKALRAEGYKSAEAYDLESFNRKYDKEEWTHVVVYYNRRFYDAEAPEGVAVLEDIPFIPRFKECLAIDRAARR